jgi:hypothetical protein
LLQENVAEIIVGQGVIGLKVQRIAPPRLSYEIASVKFEHRWARADCHD